MALEFDPTTSTYYQTAYTGPAVREPVEDPPPPPPPEETQPPQETQPTDDYAASPPPEQDPALAVSESSYPGYLGTVVDEVV